MVADTTTFALAFAVVWIGLGAYFLYLHALERRIARDLEALKARRK